MGLAEKIEEIRKSTIRKYEKSLQTALIRRPYIREYRSFNYAIKVANRKARELLEGTDNER